MLVVNIHDGSRRYFIVCMLPVDYIISRKSYPRWHLVLLALLVAVEGLVICSYHFMTVKIGQVLAIILNAYYKTNPRDNMYNTQNNRRMCKITVLRLRI